MDLRKLAHEVLTSIFEKEIGQFATESERKQIKDMINKIMEPSGEHEFEPLSEDEVEIEQDPIALRKNNIWTILHLIIVMEGVVLSENFYDLDKHFDDFLYARDKLLEELFHPTTEEIEIAIRLCAIKYAKGECSHKLTTSEIQNIHNWETYSFGDSNIVNNVATSFKAYWDDVLSSYKRTSAKTNRINYLIEHLKEMSAKETLQQLPNFTEKINELILYYNSLL